MVVQREFPAEKRSCGRALRGGRAHGTFQELKKSVTAGVLRKTEFNVR